MTDILLAAAGLCAFAILLRDPELAQPRHSRGFVIAAAAGIMAKSVAGILVLAVMLVVTGFGSRRWMRAGVAVALVVAISSPWFLYNFFLHRDWFLADMGFQTSHCLAVLRIKPLPRITSGSTSSGSGIPTCCRCFSR